jgi:plasmid stability protein
MSRSTISTFQKRQTPGGTMPNISIRNVPADVKKALAVKAALKEVTLPEFLRQALAELAKANTITAALK